MYYDYKKNKNNKMDGKTKHPFVITCRKCGGNDVEVYAHDNHDLSIKCKDCGLYLNCGSYHTKEYDYSNSISN